MKFKNLFRAAVSMLFLAVVSLVPATAQTVPASDTLTITVDHSMSLPEMITAGLYDWVDPEITETKFQAKGTGKFELNVELIHFSHPISSDNAVEELAKRGLRPATLEELLAFGAKYREPQFKFPIVALGSSAHVDDSRSVVCLQRFGVARDLHLLWWVGGWSGGYRFLAVRLPTETGNK
jgi:hypothetical protein